MQCGRLSIESVNKDSRSRVRPNHMAGTRNPLHGAGDRKGGLGGTESDRRPSIENAWESAQAGASSISTDCQPRRPILRQLRGTPQPCHILLDHMVRARPCATHARRSQCIDRAALVDVFKS